MVWKLTGITQQVACSSGLDEQQLRMLKAKVCYLSVDEAKCCWLSHPILAVTQLYREPPASDTTAAQLEIRPAFRAQLLA
jgi:hypothetical protein